MKPASLVAAGLALLAAGARVPADYPIVSHRHLALASERAIAKSSMHTSRRFAK